jgi:hypothetical protein
MHIYVYYICMLLRQPSTAKDFNYKLKIIYKDIIEGLAKFNLHSMVPKV